MLAETLQLARKLLEKNYWQNMFSPKTIQIINDLDYGRLVYCKTNKLNTQDLHLKFKNVFN